MDDSDKERDTVGSAMENLWGLYNDDIISIVGTTRHKDLGHVSVILKTYNIRENDRGFVSRLNGVRVDRFLAWLRDNIWLGERYDCSLNITSTRGRIYLEFSVGLSTSFKGEIKKSRQMKKLQHMMSI